PAVAGVAALGEPHRRLRAPQLEVARGELTAPGVEFLEPSELPQTYRGRDIREIVFAPGEQRVEVVGAAFHLPVPAVQLARCQLLGRAARDGAAFDVGPVLVRTQA